MQRQKNLFVLLACSSLLPLGAIVPAAAQQANAYQGVSKPPAEQMDTTPDAPPPPPVAQAPQPAPDSVQVTVQTVPPAPMAAAPLPSADPLWPHPRIWITPHVASTTQADSGADAVLANLERHARGETLIGLIDRARGY